MSVQQSGQGMELRLQAIATVISPVLGPRVNRLSSLECDLRLARIVDGGNPLPDEDFAVTS